jgi:ubiquinone biosynthesis protein COQ9
MAPRKRSDEALKEAVLEKALDRAPELGFSDALLARAAKEADVGAEMTLHLFPDGPASLVAYFSERCDAQMEARLTRQDIAAMKVRERITAAVLARVDALKAHKEAARRAAAFLVLPPNAALAARLVYQSVDAMWRAAGDASTDFNFYTKRAILAGVYSSTLLRWFNDTSEDESDTRAFLAARVDNVMQFEKFKAEMRERTKDWPSFSDLLNPNRHGRPRGGHP